MARETETNESCNELWDAVWQLTDALPELTAEQRGRIAQAASAALRRELERDHECAKCQGPLSPRDVFMRPSRLVCEDCAGQGDEYRGTR